MWTRLSRCLWPTSQSIYLEQIISTLLVLQRSMGKQAINVDTLQICQVGLLVCFCLTSGVKLFRVIKHTLSLASICKPDLLQNLKFILIMWKYNVSVWRCLPRICNFIHHIAITVLLLMLYYLHQVMMFLYNLCICLFVCIHDDSKSNKYISLQFLCW